ncbi:hypothetical protein LINPERHAP1_LOCUS3628 [Linum perenne]
MLSTESINRFPDSLIASQLAEVYTPLVFKRWCEEYEPTMSYSSPPTPTISDPHVDDVWDERFTLPVTHPIADSVLTLEILHSRPSKTPKPFIDAVKIPMSQILDSDKPPSMIRGLELFHPSDRLQGKVQVKLALKEHLMQPPPPMSAPPPSQQIVMEFDLLVDNLVLALIVLVLEIWYL